jgi:hypothetical protein
MQFRLQISQGESVSQNDGISQPTHAAWVLCISEFREVVLEEVKEDARLAGRLGYARERGAVRLGCVVFIVSVSVGYVRERNLMVLGFGVRVKKHPLRREISPLGLFLCR